MMDNMIIVGAAGGIGSYLARRFLHSHSLFLTYHNKRVSLEGPDVMTLELDVRSMSECALAMDEIDYQIVGGHLVLVNAVGVNVNGMGHKMPSEDWNQVIDANLTGAFNVCRAILPIMRRRGWGRIINLSSVVGNMGMPGTCAYASSKAGLDALTRVLAVENATRGVTVNSLSIGYTDTGLVSTIPKDILDRIMVRIPMGRLGDPWDIEAAVRFLIEADYVTGSAITIDGGVSCL